MPDRAGRVRYDSLMGDAEGGSRGIARCEAHLQVLPLRPGQFDQIPVA